MEFFKVSISEITEKRELRESSDDTLGSLLGSLFISSDEDRDIVETVNIRVGSLLKFQKTEPSHDEWLKFEEDYARVKELIEGMQSKYKISEDLTPHLTPTFALYEQGPAWEHESDSTELPIGTLYVGVHRGISKNHYINSNLPFVVRDWEYRLKKRFLSMVTFDSIFKNPMGNILELNNILDQVIDNR